jgi:Recombinase/Resolvase, N terminal domain
VQTAYVYGRFSHEEPLGGSERRQIQAAEAYGKANGLTIDYSLKPDRARSAYTGKHRKKGNLADFVHKVQTGEVGLGSALIVESLDALSREEPEHTLYFLLELIHAGIEVHSILDQKVYRNGAVDEVSLIDAIMRHSRYSRESKRKAERCTEAATKQREKARNGICFSARVPGWLVGVKNGKIEPHPEHAKTVKRIFQLASEGIGCSRIVDILNKERIPAFNRTKRWYDMYVSKVLRSKAVLGQYQPGTHPRHGTWAPAGDSIRHYYPRIIRDELWQRVQDIRAGNWAEGQVKVGKYHGSGRSSWRNLFTGLVVDEDGDSMIYKRVAHRQYLISSKGPKFKTHQMRYEKFEEAMLRLLNQDIDWKSLTKQPTPTEQQLKLKELAEEINHKEHLRKRYLRIIEGEAEPDQEIVCKFRDTARELRKMKHKKESLERSLNSTAAPKLTKIPMIEINQSREQANLSLKDEIRKRIARIQLVFNANIILAPEHLPKSAFSGLRSGKGQIVGTITFINGAVRFIVFDGNRAILLW